MDEKRKELIWLVRQFQAESQRMAYVAEFNDNKTGAFERHMGEAAAYGYVLGWLEDDELLDQYVQMMRELIESGRRKEA